MHVHGMQDALAEAWDLFGDDVDEGPALPNSVEQSVKECARCGKSEDACRNHFIHHRNEGKGSEPLIELVAMPHVGGGRGFVSRVDLPPGVCVLAEVPVCVWPEGCAWNTPEGQRVAVQTITQSAKAHSSAKNLHPRTLADVDEESLHRIHALHGTFLAELSAETEIAEEELVRLLLALQHNGFWSGLYDHLSMFNHSCEPNCIKFSTTTSDAGASEVWTIRHIAAGEELCISYCAPETQLRSTIRDYLQEQHRFICACTRCISDKDATEGSVAAGDAEQAEIVARALETDLGELEDELAADQLSPTELYDKLAKLLTQAQQVLAAEHILWVRLYRLAADINVALIEDDSAGSTAAVRFLQASLSALPILARYLGGYHPDLASVHHDVTEGISGLLSRAPQKLFQHFGDVIGSSIAEARTAVNKHRAMKHRVADMYETNKHYPEIKQLAAAGDHMFGCHVPACTSPHIADLQLYALAKCSAAAIGSKPSHTIEEAGSQISGASPTDEATTMSADLQILDRSLLELTVFETLPDALPTLVNHLRSEGAVLWAGAFTGSHGEISQLREQMNEFLSVAKASYDYDTDTFKFPKRKHGVTRLPRIGHGKHNIHFDAYDSEGHTILSRVAQLGRFEEVLSAYQDAPCTLSEAGISITRPRTGDDEGEGIEWHSDGGPGACTVLVCLEDVSPQQGSLGVVPRSHLQYEAGEDYDIASAGTTPLHYPYRAGVPMIIDARTVHQATNNVSSQWRAIFWFIFDTEDCETSY